MRAVKGNKAYIVDEKSKAVYVKAGFDIYDDKGKVIESGKGKTVSSKEYQKVVAELKQAKAELEKLKADKKDKK